MILFFTSGTVSYPKMVLHTQAYGLGHVSTARFWHDLRPGDRHWTVTDTGWAKAAWGGLFGQWHERATVVQVALGKPDAGHDPEHHPRPARSRPSARRRRSTACSCRPTWPRTTSPSCGTAPAPASRSTRRSSAPGRTGTGGLTVYDGYGQSETHRAGRQLPLRCRCAPARWAGRCPAGRSTSSTTTESPRPTTPSATSPSRSRTRGRSGCSASTTATPDANAPLVPRRLVLHRRQGLARQRRLPLVRGPRRRRHHVVRLPDRPVRGRVGADRARGGRGGGGGRQGRPEAHPDRLRVRRPRPGTRGERRARGRAAGPHEGADRAVQVPARDPLRRRSCRRRSAARSAAPSCATG